MRLLAVVLATGLACGGTTTAQDVNTAEELRIRNGLPNFFAKAAAGGEMRIAYLGGSITQANGWRVKTLAGIREKFPDTVFAEINAAVAGTGSDYGACRLLDHVLAHNPDLLFVEFRVNGGDLRSMEGLVRQTWMSNPKTDICFVYTVNQAMVGPLSAGRPPPFGTVLETIANHYGIPSIDMGLEVLHQIDAGDMVFKANKASGGKVVFAPDGTHPGDEGQVLYGKVILRSLDAMRTSGTPGSHLLPPQLDPLSWVHAKLVPIARAERSKGWLSVDVMEDPVTAEDRTRRMAPEAIRTVHPGETLNFTFAGIIAGWVDIPAPNATVLEVTINHGEPFTLTRRETSRRNQSAARFFFLPEQAPGTHTVRVKVLKTPGTSGYYVGPLLIVGKFLSGQDPP